MRGKKNSGTPYGGTSGKKKNNLSVSQSAVELDNDYAQRSKRASPSSDLRNVMGDVEREQGDDSTSEKHSRLGPE